MTLKVFHRGRNAKLVLECTITFPFSSEDPITECVPERGFEHVVPLFIGETARWYSQRDGRMRTPADGWDYLEAIMEQPSFVTDIIITREDRMAYGISDDSSTDLDLQDAHRSKTAAVAVGSASSRWPALRPHLSTTGRKSGRATIATESASKSREICVVWREWGSVPITGNFGHGVHFHDRQKPRMDSLVAWVEGYEWLHGNPDSVVIYCIAPDAITTQPVLRAMKAAITRRLKKCRTICGNITRRIEGIANA